MKKYIICILVLNVLLNSCKKESALVPTNYDQDWYVINDNPSDSVDHAIYLFYQQYGISVFYTDTIGVLYKNSRFGTIDTAYTLLQVNYTPLGTSGTAGYIIPGASYKVLSRKANTMKGLRFLRDSIMPLLPSAVKVKSFIMLDTLNSMTYGALSYKGFNTIAMGSVPQLEAMSADTLKRYKGATCRAILSAKVLEDSVWLNNNFYSVSRAIGKSKLPSWVTDIYQTYVYLPYTLIPYGIPSLADAGFLGKNTAITGDAQTPPTWLDVNQFLEAIFTYTTGEFTARYGTYTPVMQKYNNMKILLTGYGFTFK